MSHPFLDKINTYLLMRLVFYFSYIYDSIRETYTIPSRCKLEQPRLIQVANIIGENDESKLFKLTTKSGPAQTSAASSPLPKMPTVFRFYFYFSTLSHILITSKYIILSISKYRIVNNLEWLPCYLPGRASFFHDLAYELPGLAIMMSGSHLVWRSLWYIFYPRLHLESMLFIICDDELVSNRRSELRRKFNKLDSIQREQMYEMNKMFCQKIHTPKGQVEYLIRKDRDLTRKERLNKLVRSVAVIMCLNSIFFGTPLAIVMLNNMLSHDFFAINYQGCEHSFAGSTKPLSIDLQSPSSNATTLTMIGKQQLWTFSDPYRVGMLLADAFDNFMIIFDSASGLTWPLVTSTIMALDLTISMEDISHRIQLIAKSLTDNGSKEKHHHQQQQPSNDPPMESSIKTRSITMNTKRLPQKHKSQESLELEIIILQSDLMILFDNVRKVDTYINAFAAYAVVFWVIINVTYEVLYVSRRQEYSVNSTVVWTQTAALVLLTFTFAHLGRTHSKTVELYHTCCTLMARDPFHVTTKQSWLWLLEYYNPQKNLYSLHMGWSMLTFMNYIEFMLYSITFSLILINLLRQEFN